MKASKTAGALAAQSEAIRSNGAHPWSLAEKQSSPYRGLPRKQPQLRIKLRHHRIRTSRLCFAFFNDTDISDALWNARRIKGELTNVQTTRRSCEFVTTLLRVCASLVSLFCASGSLRALAVFPDYPTVFQGARDGKL